MREKKILKSYLLYIFAFIVLCFFGCSHSLAATTKTIYPNTNFSQNANNYIKLNESGTFGITNTNLTIQGQSYGFNFYMQENVVLNKTYTIVITFMADDLRSDFQNSYVHVSVGSGSTSSSVSIVSITRNNPSGYSTTLTIKFNPLTTGDYIQVNIISDGPPYAVLTGVSTYGIKSVTLDSSADAQDIINNQNQNTQDIINAQQSSASNIIASQESSASSIVASQESSASAIQDTMNKNLQNCHTSVNLVNITSVSLNMSNRTYVYNIPQTLESGTYTLSYDLTTNNSLSKRLQLWLSSDNNTSQYFNLSDSGKITFTMNSSFDRLQFFISSSASSNSSFSLKNIQLEKGNNASAFEPYGEQICVNKLDQQTDAIKDLNGSVNSDDIDSSSASSFFSNFTDNNHGLSGVVSAPLVAINAMLNNQCTPLSATWRETTVSLPCGYDFWSKMTGFQQFLNVALDGLLCYRILVKIFKLVEKFKNPNDDRVEVMDL